jgi:hypothetical protein
MLVMAATVLPPTELPPADQERTSVRHGQLPYRTSRHQYVRAFGGMYLISLVIV